MTSISVTLTLTHGDVQEQDEEPSMVYHPCQGG